MDNEIKWLCRRGTKELDLLLERYLVNFYAQSDQVEKDAFRALLDYQDPELYELLTGKTTSEQAAVQSIIEKINHSSVP